MTDRANDWDYESSVAIVKPMVLTWRNVTVEIVSELYKAREALSRKRDRTSQMERSWTDYLDDVGLPRTTAHRWLECYLPEERKLLTTEELEARKRVEDRRKQDAAVARDKRVKEAKRTGRKPDDWDDAAEREYERSLRQDQRREEKVEAAKEAAHAEREKSETFWEPSEDEPSTEEMIEAVGAMVEKTKARQGFKQRIRLSQSGEADTFVDALMDYLEELDSDSRRIEACQNIIKVCRNVANELQREDVSVGAPR